MVEEEQIGDHEEEPACDFCGQSKALVYCRADTARLCLSCDRHVHRANSVSSKHPRALLCNSCSSAPSSIFCSAHGQVLCSNCDFEAHDRGARPHDRRPVEAFTGCPAVSELVSVLGVGVNGEFLKKEDDDDDDFVAGGEFLGDKGSWVWDTPRVVRLDDLIVPSSNASHGFQAMGVPPLPKNRNLACGKNKQEILQQLRELNKTESHFVNDCEEVEPVAEPQAPLPHINDQGDNLHSELGGDATFTNTPNLEAGLVGLQASELQWNSNDRHEATDPMMFPYAQQAASFSAVTASFPGGVAGFATSALTSGGDGDPRSQVIAESLSPLTPKRPLEIVCPDRDTVLSRYKEKRKARRYDKLIRYETRKARADSRARIKGRFAKVNQDPKP